MACDCIRLINDQLAADDLNTELDVSHWFSDGQPTVTTVIVQVSKLDSKVRKKARRIIPEYCPFCGKEYRGRAALAQRDAGDADVQSPR